MRANLFGRFAMIALTLDGVKTWLNNKGMLDGNGNVSLIAYNHVDTYSIPPDCGHKTAIGRLIANVFNWGDEALLWIDEYGMWPSCEDMNLFSGFRRSLGEASSLHEKPGHIMSKNDTATLATLLSIVLYFSWGAVFIPESKEYTIRISHDEIISIFFLERGNFNKESESLQMIFQQAS